MDPSEVERLQKKLARAEKKILQLEKMIETQVREVYESKQEVLERNRFLDSLIQASPNLLITTNLSGEITLASPNIEELLGSSSCSLTQTPLQSLIAPSMQQELSSLRQSLQEHGHTDVRELNMLAESQERIPCMVSSSLVLDAEGTPTGFIHIAQDSRERKRLESQLLQSQKLEAVGQLSAGVAHEINTPVQYIGSNVEFIQESWEDLTQLFESYGSLKSTFAESQKDHPLLTSIEELEEEVDLEYILEEIPNCLKQTSDGIATITTIVGSLKAFSHPGSTEAEAHSLEDIVKSTLEVTRNEWKYVSQSEVAIAPEVGSIHCFRSELSQVIANLVINAAHAIEDKIKASDSDELGKIRIEATPSGGNVELKIIDNGPGIPQEIQQQVFDPFFTTKAVGKGTGQGLAIAHSIITQKHRGSIEVESEPGRTCFTLHLPMQPVACEVPAS